MASRIYEDIIMEHFDINDDYTRKTLLSINEADQNKVLESLTSKLYSSIMEKVDDIDFGSIPDSKGDITKIENYDKLLETIGVIKSILVEFRQETTIVDTIQLAIENVQSRKDLFTKGFMYNLDLPIVMYNTIVLSIISATSLIIATSIEFVKDAGSGDYNVKFDKVAYVKSKDNLLYSNLARFNKACATKEVDRCIEHVIKNGSRQLTGDTLLIVSIMATIGIIVSIIPLLRELIFFFFNTKQQISDYFTIQADLLTINAEYVKQNSMMGKSDKERKIIAKKQTKYADMFRKIGNDLAVDAKTADMKTKKDLKNEDKKYKLQEVTPEKLDSAPEVDNTSSLF